MIYFSHGQRFFSGDDDFLIPESLSKSEDFLEKNLDFRAAQEMGIVFYLNNSGEYVRLKAVVPYGKKRSIKKFCLGQNFTFRTELLDTAIFSASQARIC